MHNITVTTTLNRTLFTVILSVIILIVFMLSVVFLNVIILIVVAPIFELLRSKNNSIETAKTSKQLKFGQNLLKFLE